MPLHLLGHQGLKTSLLKVIGHLGANLALIAKDKLLPALERALQVVKAAPAWRDDGFQEVLLPPASCWVKSAGQPTPRLSSASVAIGHYVIGLPFLSQLK
eukprot:2079529-Amphidinium_carterae.1